ncbi:TPA: Lrp/AsnC family transcriptional regulator [Candidatus Bathyarchaeota archaeon]|nr:Lrp/AsnC family transcriptional regulator [Candidatus Bathyarchaeota archaeon]
MFTRIDRAILRRLQEDGRVAYSELAEALGVPRATLHRRVKALEREGVIRRYTAVLDPTKLGYKFLAFVLIRARRTVPKEGESSQVTLARELLERSSAEADFPWIEEAHIVTGPYDILLKVWVREWDGLTTFLTAQLPAYEDIEHTETILVLNRVG